MGKDDRTINSSPIQGCKADLSALRSEDQNTTSLNPTMTRSISKRDMR